MGWGSARRASNGTYDALVIGDVEDVIGVDARIVGADCVPGRRSARNGRADVHHAPRMRGANTYVDFVIIMTNSS
jgi:hypothetical protein